MKMKLKIELVSLEECKECMDYRDCIRCNEYRCITINNQMYTPVCPLQIEKLKQEQARLQEQKDMLDKLYEKAREIQDTHLEHITYIIWQEGAIVKMQILEMDERFRLRKIGAPINSYKHIYSSGGGPYISCENIYLRGSCKEYDDDIMETTNLTIDDINAQIKDWNDNWAGWEELPKKDYGKKIVAMLDHWTEDIYLEHITYKIWQEDDTVKMQILEMDERFRCKKRGNTLYYKNIKSDNHPVFKNGIYLRGSSKQYDDQIMSTNCLTIDYIKAQIKDWNDNWEGWEERSIDSIIKEPESNTNFDEQEIRDCFLGKAEIVIDRSANEEA